MDNGVAWSEAAEAVKSGGLAVIPTDTLYGIVASAGHPDAVERLYRVRGRDTKKPCIVLIPSLEGILEYISEDVFHQYEKIFRALWPGPVSMIVPVHDAESKRGHLHRGTDRIAFRVPDDEALRAFLVQAGPVVAPSANPEGTKPAETIEEARRYFGDQAAVYVDGGKRSGLPTTLLSLSKDAILTVREGSVSVSEIARRIPGAYRKHLSNSTAT